MGRCCQDRQCCVWDGPACADAARDGWSDRGWTDLGVWERSTWDKTGSPDERLTIRDIRTLPPLERVKALSRLTQEELAILKSMQYVD